MKTTRSGSRGLGSGDRQCPQEQVTIGGADVRGEKFLELVDDKQDDAVVVGRIRRTLRNKPRGPSQSWASNSDAVG